MSETILIVDDDSSVRGALAEFLKDAGFRVAEAAGGKEALLAFTNHSHPDLVLLDLVMPEMGGLFVLDKVREIAPNVPIILITGHGDVATAVAAMKLGAYDFLVKPPDVDYLLLIIERALDKVRLTQKIRDMEDNQDLFLQKLLGTFSTLKNVIVDIRRVASSDLSLIIEGETGTGKTFIAHIIHNLSKRSKGPFVTLDVGSIPETLIESELFGYEKGAFTGAEKKKAGYFEMAEGGTLFIDEVQNMPLNLQSKLLKVVEEKKFYPIGGNSTVDTDVRIIVASNSDMSSAVKEKKFRADLYYRLNEFTIQLPPLRKRADGIASLARTFLSEASMELKKGVTYISDDALDFLMKQPWPGNVRELRNTIRRAVLLCDGNELTMEMVSQCMGETDGRHVKTEWSNLQSQRLPMSLEETEKIAIRVALDQTKGNRTRAAEILQISLNTLRKKIKMYNL
ncbi:MAG: sigma-54-dependent Fis family transcriptional regulator [Nitrospirae bacterium]|nr:sigma-54-dependent Fis family transcriptional regulator [Nitrospirota bacterium]